MKTSDIGIKKIAQREGVILHVYKDSRGLPTAGCGHLLVGQEKIDFPVGKKITQAQSDAWLKDDLKECEDAINSAVKVSLTQNEFDALVSFAFNIGIGGFKKSSVLRLLNQGDKTNAAKAFMKWVKPPEITGRRNTERIQFLTPYKVSVPPVPVPDANTNPAASDLITVNNNEVADISKPASDDSTGAAPPQPTVADVVVTKEKMSLSTRVVSIGTAIFGGIMFVKNNLEAVYNKAIDSIDGKVIAYAVLSAGIVALGIWLYQQGRKSANAITQAKIASAADPNANTVDVV